MKKAAVKKVLMPKISEGSSSAEHNPRASSSGPTREEIQLRAYEIYLERHGAPGDALADWVQAEQELLEKQRKLGRNGKAQAA